MTDAVKMLHRVDFALLGLALVFVLLRLYVQIFRLRAFSAVDVLVVVAWFCFLGDVLVHMIMQDLGFLDPRIKYTKDGGLPDYDAVITDRHKLKTGFVLEYAFQSVYFIELYSIKVAFILLYYRWFLPSMVKLRWALHATFAFVIFSGVSSILISLFWCFPIPRNWSVDPKDRCIGWASLPVYFYYTGLNILTDIPVYILPFFLLPVIYPTATRLKLAGVALVFSVGTLSIACTIFRITLTASGDDGSKIAVWFTAEQATAIAAICCLPVRWLWTYEYSRSARRRRSRSSLREKIRVLQYFSKSDTKSKAAGSGGAGMFDMGGELEMGVVGTAAWTEGTGGTDGTRSSSHVSSAAGSFVSGGRGLTSPRRPSVVVEEGEAPARLASADSNDGPDPLASGSGSQPPEAPRVKNTRRWWGTRGLRKAAEKRPVGTTTFGAPVPDPSVTNLDAVVEEREHSPGGTAGQTATSATVDSFTFGRRT